MNKNSSDKSLKRMKGSVNFHKNIGAPKTTEYIQRSGRSHDQSTLVIQLKHSEHSKPHNLVFLFHDRTQVGELIAYLKRKIDHQLVYFSSGNFHIDYFLTIHNKYVRQFPIKKLKLTVKYMIEAEPYSFKEFQIIKCIGSGGFSKVFLGRKYGIMMAMKAISKEFIFENQKQSIVENQKAILQACNAHPFVTKLYMSFQTQKYLIFCLEYCNGGELFNLIRKVKKMKEHEAKFYFLEVLSVIQFLHSKQILYRDLKPENIILDANGHIRLADYGLSKVMRENRTYSFCGSAEYMAPQMLLKKGHGYQVDYYCLGALLYELVTGLPPFYSANQTQLFTNILTSELTFPPHVVLSQEIKDLLQKMLSRNVSNRVKNVKEIFEHPWVSEGLNYSDILSMKLVPPYPTQMFADNFDNSQFIHEEELATKAIENEKQTQIFHNSLKNFNYVSPEVTKVMNEIQKNKKDKIDFYKKGLQAFYERHSSRSNQKRIESIQKRKTTQKHYFPGRLPLGRKPTHLIENQYLRGTHSAKKQPPALSPRYQDNYNIYTNKPVLLASQKKTRKNREKSLKLSISLSKDRKSMEASLHKGKKKKSKEKVRKSVEKHKKIESDDSNSYLRNLKEKYSFTCVNKLSPKATFPKLQYI